MLEAPYNDVTIFYFNKSHYPGALSSTLPTRDGDRAAHILHGHFVVFNSSISKNMRFQRLIFFPRVSTFCTLVYDNFLKVFLRSNVSTEECAIISTPRTSNGNDRIFFLKFFLKHEAHLLLRRF